MSKTLKYTDMFNKIIIPESLLFIALLFSATVSAQVKLPENWDTEKIKGTTNYPYPAAAGYPYLTGKFINGEIEFRDGIKIGNIQLRYSKYRDELVYYNKDVSSQVIIDKISLKGFSLTDSTGVRRIFRQLYFNGYSPGNRFFEVLVDGKVSLLVYRKTVLESCAPYSDIFGRLNNMSYQDTFGYYFYQPEKGFEPVKISKISLVSKFSKPDQAVVKKILRKNGIKINNEQGLVRAWRLIADKQLDATFKFGDAMIRP